MRFKATSLPIGTTKFRVTIKNSAGSYCISNAVNVIYNTDRSNMIGTPYYDNNDNVVGIICDVDESCNATKIVALEDSGTYAWAPLDTTGYNKQFITIIDDGSMNWGVVTKVDKTAEENAGTNYPAFNACNQISTGGLDWYLPASGELLQISANRLIFNNISVEGFTNFVDGQYWTSSDVGNNQACMFNMKDCYTNANPKSTSNNVRAIAKIK